MGAEAARGRSSSWTPRLSAGGRVVIAFAVGVLVAAGLVLFVSWQVATLVGWDAAALVFLAWTSVHVYGRDATTTERIATWEDPSRRSAELLLVGACVASLAGVGAVLVDASGADGTARIVLTGVAVVSVVVSWLAVNTVFTLRYAHLYYREHGGIVFPGDQAPDYGDFAYVAFTIGMTFQVSDTAVTSGHIRMTCLRHALVTYLFGIVIVAMTINVVASLLRH